MSENLEKFTSSDQSQKLGKLTPEEVKEMVKKYKEEHEGLLPEYFSLPGEEKEEREYPEELLDYYQLKEKLKPIEQRLKNETLRKNVIEKTLSDIQERYQEKRGAAVAFRDYFYLLSYPGFNEIKLKYPEEIKQIEQGLKNETLRKKLIKEILSDIQKAYQDEKVSSSVFLAFRDYFYLLSYPGFNEIKLKYPEEIKQIEQGLKNETLRKKLIELILRHIEYGQEIDISAWWAFYGYSSLLSYPGFNEIKLKYPEEIKQIEQGLKNETLRKKLIELILRNIEEGKDYKDWFAFDGYFSLLSYLSHLYKIGQKRLAEMESQKAMHPEKKKLPPIPEEKAF